MRRVRRPASHVLSVVVALAVTAQGPAVRAQAPAPTALPAPAATPELAPEHALALALESNPSFRAALFDAVAARAAADSASAARMPTFVTNTNGAYREGMSATQMGGIRTRDRTVSNTLGLRYTTDVGTVLALDVVNTTIWREINRDNSTSALSLIGPSHSTTATLTARQPLIRGAGHDAVLAAQRQADAREEQLENTTESSASQLVADVLTAYWELWYAERSVAVQRAAVELATRQLTEARQKLRLGTLAEADVLRFATEEASLRETLTQAEATATGRALELGRLLGLEGAAALALDTVDAPPELPTVPALDPAIESLRASSPSLLALAAQVEGARAQAEGAVNASRARLDLTGTLGAAALWAPNDPYSGVWSFPGGRPAVVATMGLELELPLVSSVRQAQRANARATLDAAETRYDAEAARLSASLATEHASLASIVARVELARATADVSSQLAEAERARLALGTSTPTVVVQAQQTARESELRYARTRVDSALSSVRFANSAGTLLDRFGIEVPEGVSP